jgi:hypothetical protein
MHTDGSAFQHARALLSAEGREPFVVAAAPRHFCNSCLDHARGFGVAFVFLGRRQQRRRLSRQRRHLAVPLCCVPFWQGCSVASGKLEEEEVIKLQNDEKK